MYDIVTSFTYTDEDAPPSPCGCVPFSASIQLNHWPWCPSWRVSSVDLFIYFIYLRLYTVVIRGNLSLLGMHLLVRHHLILWWTQGSWNPSGARLAWPRLDGSVPNRRWCSSWLWLGMLATFFSSRGHRRVLLSGSRACTVARGAVLCHCGYKAFPSCSTDATLPRHRFFCHPKSICSISIRVCFHAINYSLSFLLLGRFGYHCPLQPCCQIVYCQIIVFTVLPLTSNVRQF